MKGTTNILIVGVGGQGILLAGDLLARAAMSAGFDVKKSEVHGMAQRGGSVNSQIRFGEKVHSPLIPQGETDILLSFERLEPLRWLNLCGRQTRAIVSDQIIHSMTTGTGAEKYPDKVEDELAACFGSLQLVPALYIAREIGNLRLVNILLLGLAACHMPFERELWKKVIEERLPKKTLEINLKAFDYGFSMAL